MRNVLALILSAMLGSVAGGAAGADETGLAASHDWVRSGGRTCFSDHVHSGTGDGLTKDSARQLAIRSWADFVDLEYGSDWARYSLAAAPRVAYTKAEKGWTANVEARPCRK